MMWIPSHILLIYMTLSWSTYPTTSGIAPDLGLSHFAKLDNSAKTDLKETVDVSKDENKVHLVDVVDTETEVFIAGDDVVSKDEFTSPGVSGRWDGRDSPGVSGGWHGRDVLPYRYDPMEECQAEGEEGQLSYLYCPALQRDGKSIYCCGTRKERFCCTSADWVKEKDEEHSLDDLPTWAIVLIVIGGLLLTALIVWLVLCIFCKVAECLCCSFAHILRCLCCCCKDDHNDEERMVLVKETHIHPPPVYNTVTTQDLYRNVTPRNQQQNLYPALPTAPQYPPPYKQ